MIWFLMVLFMVMVLFCMSMFFQMKWNVNTEGSSAFECGFTSLSMDRSFQFLHFFHIAVLFVVFDLELAALLPMVTSYPSEEIWSILWSFVGLILVVGLIWEGEMSSLDWKE